MISLQMRRNRIIGLAYSVLLVLLGSTTAQVQFKRGVNSCLYVGDNLIWVAQYSGTSALDSVNWYFSGQRAGDIQVLVATCSVFGSPDNGYPHSRMTYSCDSGTNTYNVTISNLDGTEQGDWGVSFTDVNFVPTSTVNESFRLCIKCPNKNVTFGSLDITESDVREGIVAGLICDEGYISIGSTEFACQADGTWLPPLEGCKGTTTTTTSTMTTSTTTPTPVRTSRTISTSLTLNSTTTVSLPASRRTTTADTTSAISAMAATAATTTIATSSASAIMTVLSTFKTATTISSLKSDQSLITMIIVVSVIGGIVVLAIFMLIFWWVHCRKCFIHSHDRNRFLSSEYTNKSKRLHTDGGYSTTRMENAVKDYYFYGGKINTVYDGTFMTSNYYPYEEAFQNAECTKQCTPGAYQYDYNWKLMDRL